MIAVGYFIDGPMHGSHLEMEAPVQMFHVARPAGRRPLRHFSAEPPSRGSMPDLYVTIETGAYEREDKPGIYSPRVAVWVYHWKGWQ